ncbi:MAG: hypothetical protein NW223_11615 [Hyphomicrobiaceae bacterium]|nr:hypothetical protein [Hyphomicrobiaceae bacterium]
MVLKVANDLGCTGVRIVHKGTKKPRLQGIYGAKDFSIVIANTPSDRNAWRSVQRHLRKHLGINIKAIPLSAAND